MSKKFVELTKYINPLIKEFYLSENKEYVSNSEIILDFTSSAMYKLAQGMVKNIQWLDTQSVHKIYLKVVIQITKLKSEAR
ncbi:hypothetical protein LA20533_00460 [Amylolactobacillus amylophilus DSM 20533 = JCM 1125]|uniref:Uncharacterized protein n=1 Tax=Amylolactobacillus amylophilus DSM 20533 = JCM 1125 TaxID=1423721 RepID=A0A1L6XA72_9LACO|nr:hypothetical protein LA20533_00460 [Amylolactobacillus amylophilus DSM 20533 = JCM 1125]GED79813.1 hypothetical protein LAM01_02860 [Amylolactobacillus amylophilus]